MGQMPANIPEEILKKLYSEGLTQDQIAAQLGCSQAAVWRRLKKLGVPLRSKAEANILASPYRTLRRDFNGDLHTKAYLLGFCKGDVHVWIRGNNSETIRLMSSTTKSEQIELFQNIFGSYGRVYVSKPDRAGAVHMNAFVNLSFSFLLDREDKISAWVFSSDNIFFAFFAGYVDAEGTIGVYNNFAVFKIDTYQKNILLQSYEIFCKHEIICPAPYICTKQGYANKHGHRYRHDLWRLKIGAKQSLLKLFEAIKPYLKHKGRIGQMETAISSIEKRNLKKSLIMENRNNNVPEK